MPQLTLLVHKTQELKDILDNDEEEDSMTHQIMTFWFKERWPKLIHEYSLVGYILSSNPQIMNNARERILDSPIYSEAVKRLFGKLLVSENLVLLRWQQSFWWAPKLCEPDRVSDQWHNVVHSREEWLCCFMLLAPYLDAIKNQGTWKTGLLGSIQNFRNRNSQMQLETGEKD